MSRIAILGLGYMGVPIANRLASASHEVCGLTRDGNRRPGLDGAVAVRPMETPWGRAAEGGTEVLILCLPDAAAIRAALAQTKVLDSLASGGLVIDMGTTGLEGTRWLAGECAARGIDLVDAPVSGGVVGAEAGRLTLFLGGDAGAVARAADILRACGTPHHLGETGAGQAAKLANQIIVADTIAAVAEGLEFARTLGVDRASLLTALAGGFADSRVLQVHGPKIVAEEYGSAGPIRLHLKDLGLAQAADPAAFARLEVANAVARTFADLAGNGHAETDHSGYALRFRQEEAE
ncbi:NAD(P)-dependent oxidoreductase [Epibacterium sp. Ofav1-8]|uniref:NAD(P)-dependent oxidoreductase n=1 Tax=Epibacterium sp. Ofav1-8 TaxID=2917735 RepID=UPI001EF64993|nr:NAD(P)-dependent oxidoreductase [Epibacterium sp. Ofav1-8]